MALKLDIYGSNDVSIAENVEFAQRAEAAGFDGVGLPDHLEHGRDGFISLALAAGATSRIEIYPAVANALTRHPFQLAGLANSLHELAPGRSKFNLATGASTAIHTGQQPATLARLRSTAVAIKRLLRGETVSFGTSAEERIIGATPPGPPVAITASGPRATQLAGEIADEALLLIGLTPALRAMGMRSLAEGAARAGRSLAGFPVTFVAPISVAATHEAALEQARGSVYTWLRVGRFNPGLDELGLQVPVPAKPQDISDRDLALMAEHFLIAGTPESCADRLHQLAGEGVERIALTTTGYNVVTAGLVGLFERHVFPALR